MFQLKEFLKITPSKIIGFLFMTFLIESFALGLAEHSGRGVEIAYGLPFVFHTQQCSIISSSSCLSTGFSLIALILDIVLIYLFVSLSFFWKPFKNSSSHNPLLKKSVNFLTGLFITFISFIILTFLMLILSILLPHPVLFFI